MSVRRLTVAIGVVALVGWWLRARGGLAVTVGRPAGAAPRHAAARLAALGARLGRVRIPPPARLAGDTPARVTGVVLDGDGVPAGGLLVEGRFAELPVPPRALTDGDGRFALDLPLAYGTSAFGHVVVEHAGEVAVRQVDVARPGTVPDLELRLAPRLEVGGTVLADGRPCAGAEVGFELVGSQFETGSPRATMRSDHAGHFHFTAWGPGVYKLDASIGTVVSGPSWVQLLVGAPAKPLELALGPLRELTVHVSDQDGHPLLGAEVRPAYSVRPIASSDAAGDAELAANPWERSFEVVLAGFQPARVEVSPGARAVSVRLLRAAWVRGVVHAPADGVTRILTRRIGSIGDPVLTLDAPGEFAVAVMPGTWEVYAYVEGVGVSSVVTLEGRADRDGVVLVVGGGNGSLTGVLRGSDGAPLAGETIVISRSEARAQPQVVTDAVGRFRLDDLPAGTWNAWAYPGQGRFAIHPGVSTDITLVRPPDDPTGITADDGTPSFSREREEAAIVVIDDDPPRGLLPGDRITHVDGVPLGDDDYSAPWVGAYDSIALLEGVRPATGQRVRARARRDSPQYPEDCH